MQVADVTTFVIRNPPPSFGSSHFVVLRVDTDLDLDVARQHADADGSPLPPPPA